MRPMPPWSERDDTELLELAREGDAEAFAAVYERHNRLILAFLARRLPAHDLAADLLAETFAQLLVLVRTPGRPLPDTPVAWLLTTARRLLVNGYRRGKVESVARQKLAMQPLMLDDTDLDRIGDIAVETDLMRELARLLPPDQLAALTARVLDGREYSTIAGKMQCSESVVRQRVSRALHTLRDQDALGGHDG
jgi:RNA polymerase sigma-70 factor (ECF subfamily)